MRIKSKRSARKRCSDIWPRLILAGKEISSNKEKLNVSGPLSKLRLSVSSPLYQENWKQAWRTLQKSARLPQTQKYKLVSKRLSRKEQREPGLCYVQDCQNQTKPMDALSTQDGLVISAVSQQGIRMTEMQVLRGQECFILTAESNVIHRKLLQAVCKSYSHCSFG